MSGSRFAYAVAAPFREYFLYSLRKAEITQYALLQQILKVNENTWFGQHYHFAAMRSFQDYQQRIPISTFQDVAEYLDRVAAGELNVLTREKINYLQITTGSATGQQKLIPSTLSYRRKVWQAMLASQGFLHQNLRKLGMQRGPGLMFIYAVPTGFTSGRIPYGTATAHLAGFARKFWEQISVAPLEAIYIVDPDTRRYVHWLFALHRDRLSFVGAPYTMPLIKFASALFQYSAELIRDIADGTLDSSLALSQTQRHKILARLRPDKERAAFLEKLAVNQGGLLPRTIWPELGWVLAVHGPGFRIYEPQLAYWYGHKFAWGMPYMACEGLIGIPGHPNSYSHIPAITTTFLEFIPESDWELSNPKTCLATQLIPGGRYEVVLTGWNGFYRYRLGDAIEVDNIFNGVPTFRVVSRRNGILSVIWEKTTEAQAVEAVVRCESDCNISFTDFVIDIDYTALPARYQLWAELSQPNVNKDTLQKQFDINLRSTNVIYNSLRDNGEIGFPIARLLPPGTFERFRTHREKEGASIEQYKVLHTIPEWKYASNNALREVIGGGREQG